MPETAEKNGPLQSRVDGLESTSSKLLEKISSLRKIGVRKIGHRIKLMKSVAALKAANDER